MINEDRFEQIISMMSNEISVKEEVLVNHDDNRWWPIYISDKRMRLIIAGLSTRISYNMILTYQEVVLNISKYSYEQFSAKTDEEISVLIHKLGLISTRLKYIRSMIGFIYKYQNILEKLDSKKFIQLIAQEVCGASYKVAQCCVLYYKGYYCGIMPVDSGMKDVLLPCLGFDIPRGNIGHLVGENELEDLTRKINIYNIIKGNGYLDRINIPPKGPYTWWVHLVMIYYKRIFCNKHRPQVCPLYNNSLVCDCRCERNILKSN